MNQPSSHIKDRIEVGYHAFVSDGGEGFGAVREVLDDGVIVYVENAGDFRIPLDAIEAVHSQKVILHCASLDEGLLAAIGHAHSAEEDEPTSER